MVLITKLLGLINQLITGGPHIVVKVSPRFVASCHRRVMTMVEKKTRQLETDQKLSKSRGSLEDT
jgi:hypothetical protein